MEGQPALVAELALNMPVSSGLFLTPSLVLGKNQAARCLSLGLQTRWLM